MNIAEVIIDIIQGQIDKPFDYQIDEKDLLNAHEGCKVLVPFARSWQKGYIIKIKDASPIKKLRKIKEILTPPLLNEAQLELIEWLHKEYFCFYNTAIRTVLPPEISDYTIRMQNYVYLNDNLSQPDFGRAFSQEKVWQYLKNKQKPLPLKYLRDETKVSMSVIQALVEKGLLEIKGKKINNDPLQALQGQMGSKKIVAPGLGQEQLLEMLKKNLEDDIGGRYLWQLNMGEDVVSTYLLLLSAAVQSKKTALLVMPEIQQIVNVLKEFILYFPDELAVFHSGLTTAEKYDQYCKVKDGRAKIIVGTRSAIFLPFSKIDFAIIHEEEDGAHWPMDYPKYSVQRVLQRRLSETGVLLLVSLTPTITSFFEASQGQSKLIRSTAGNPTITPVKVVDMCNEFEQGNVSIFSLELQEAMQSVLARKKRALLFVNRRGYAPFMLCRNCGFVVRCPNCQVTLTLHKGEGMLNCHYCSYKQKSIEICPECKSVFLRSFGIGTERVAEEAKKIFSKGKTLIFDSDAIKNRRQFKEAIAKVTANRVDIVVGTQMALKDYLPPFDLIAVISADVLVNLPQYTAREEAYNMLSYLKHMIWKSGGEFIIQTYTPDHDSIKTIATGDYNMFAEGELAYRKEFKHPPFYSMLFFTIMAKNEEGLMAEVLELHKEILASITKGDDMEVLGPGRATMYQFKGFYRWQIACRSKNQEKLYMLVEDTREFIKKMNGKGIFVNLDINPRRMI